ncbi:MAG: hypothetical protein AB1938_24185 [Myxococcota bacterium]
MLHRASLVVLFILASCRPPAATPPVGWQGTFSSGFEAGTTLSGPEVVDSRFVGQLGGRDSETGASWGDGLPGARRGFFYLVASSEDIGAIIETRLETVPGRSGAPSRALYQAVLADHQSTGSRARNMFVLLNDDADALGRGYVRHALFLQPDLEDQLLPRGAWRQVIEWWETGNAYRLGINLQRDEATGALFWSVHGDFWPNWQRDWTIENLTAPVPVGRWGLFEARCVHAAGDDGRLQVKVDCVVVAGHVGRTRAAGRLDALHLFKVYAAAESLARGPAWQRIDDVALGDSLPDATCP